MVGLRLFQKNMYRRTGVQAYSVRHGQQASAPARIKSIYCDGPALLVFQCFVIILCFGDSKFLIFY